MEVFITKYALTSGIRKADVELSSSNKNSVIEKNGKRFGINFYHKPFWHLTIEDAIIHAEELRDKRISSLKKSLSKLQKLSFNQPITTLY